MSLKKFEKFLPALLIALPLLAVAAFGSANGGFVGIASAGYGGQHAPYKESFAAAINAPQEVPPTPSQATGDSLFDVSMNEREIDYSVILHNETNVTDVALYCAKPAVNGPKVVSLFHAASSTNTQTYSGTIAESDVLASARNCNPNITTLPHLVQAMREGNIYINILTAQYPNGEIRGQLNRTTTSPGNGNGGGNGNGNGGGNGQDGNHETINPSSATVHPGQHLNFEGRHFPHETNVNITRNGVLVGIAHADGGGNFTTGSIVMPSTPGVYTFTFTPVSGGAPINSIITVQ